MSVTAPGLKKWNASELPLFPGTWYSERALMVPVSISTFTARSGLEQRVSLDQFIPRIWSLVFPGMKRTSVDTLEAFWRDREGPLKPFKWQSEETSDLYYVRFDQSSFKPEHIGPDVWSLSFQFREIFPGEINLEG